MPTAITHEPIFNTPASSTNTAVVRWSGTTGSTLQDCGVLIDGSNNLIIPAQGDLRLSDTTGGQYVALQANGTTTTHTLTLPAAQGSASTVLTNDGAGALTWAAAAVSAISRAGGTSTEATTTSTSVVDLIDVSSMTIPAAAPVQLKWAMRKTTGAASAAGGGLKFNGVVVHEAAVSGNVEWLSSTANSAQDGIGWTELCGRVANYLTGADNYHTAHVTATGAQTVSNSGSPTQTAPFTAVEITNFIVRGISSSSVTLGCDEFQIYEGSIA